MDHDPSASWKNAFLEHAASIAGCRVQGRDCWQILGIRKQASLDDVDAQTRKVRSQLHPDSQHLNRVLDSFLNNDTLSHLQNVQLQALKVAIRNHVLDFMTGILLTATNNCNAAATGAGNAVRNLWSIASEHSICDRRRAHTNELHLWIITQQFQVLVTEFHPILHQSHHNINAAPAGIEVMEHARALVVWRDFWTYRPQGNLKSLMAGFSEGRRNMVFTCPEAGRLCTKALRSLQENVLSLLGQNIDFRLGILINIHRCPLTFHAPNQKTKDLWLQLQLTQLQILDVHMWPLIHEVIFLDQFLVGQFATWGDGQVVRSNMYGLVVFTNSPAAMECYKNMVQQVQLPEQDHPNLSWGQHRTDWST